jgi:hypothetical protein
MSTERGFFQVKRTLRSVACPTNLAKLKPKNTVRKLSEMTV